MDQACAGPFREAVTKSNQVTVSPGPHIPDMANKFGKGRLYFLVPRLPVCLFVTIGQSQRYGTISLFLEQITPSRAAHEGTFCEDFCGCRAGRMGLEISDGPQLKRLMSVR